MCLDGPTIIYAWMRQLDVEDIYLARDNKRILSYVCMET
jgi:hypothetical protein